MFTPSQDSGGYEDNNDSPRPVVWQQGTVFCDDYSTPSPWFLYILVVAIFVAYLTGRTRPAGTPYLDIFRVAGTAAFLAYGFRAVSDGIWYGKPWKVVIKESIDGLIYSLLMAGTFGWLWPH